VRSHLIKVFAIVYYILSSLVSLHSAVIAGNHLRAVGSIAVEPIDFTKTRVCLIAVRAKITYIILHIYYYILIGRIFMKLS